jgi:hypothetical protein
MDEEIAFMKFDIDDDVVDLVWELAKPRKFETFGEALRRLLSELRTGKPNGGARHKTVDELFAELDALPDAEEAAEKYIREKKRQRKPSPDPKLWVSQVPELRGVTGLTSWQAVCDHLRVQTGFDSARRKLQDFVREERPKWPPVPDA